MKRLFCYIIFFLTLISSQKAKAQTTFYDVTAIQKIEIYFSQPNWDYQLDTSRYGLDDYVTADWVKINGVQFYSPGVKYKGNSSYDSTYIKNPIHIELDNSINQSYQGITDIKLGNGYADPSVIREVLSYNILKNYMHSPRSNFAQLYINGNYIGLYSNDESINKDFCSNHFYSSSKTFFKCNPQVTPAPNTKSNLKYISADSSDYFNFYELKSDEGWNELVQLCDSITNFPSSIANNVDVDRVMWMLAFNMMFVNLDSYTGAFCQNYYIYKDKTNRFNPIMWDLNMCFGGFPYVGSGNTSLAGLTVANMQQLPPNFHSSDQYWPLINDVFLDLSLRKQYFAHAWTILNENIANSSYISLATQLQSLIDTAVQSDVNSFFTYSQFQNALDTNYQVGTYWVPGIRTLMSARLNYLQNLVGFNWPHPVISSVAASDTTPDLTTTVNISANVTNTNTSGVYLGYRRDKKDKFTRIQMYDDGTHNDGVAGDDVYGASIIISSLLTDYYVYAENANMGMFSPERAEHEFYSVKTNVVVPTEGQLVINEFLASNTIDATNENGNHSDWIELYNSASSPISLFGLYLTDDVTNPSKFSFPQGTTILPDSFLIVWADEENSTSGYVHANFKLAVAGEALMLSNGENSIIDSISFGVQTDDVSMGRCPNGTGDFDFLSLTSFNSENCIDPVIPVDPPLQTYVYLSESLNELNYVWAGDTAISKIQIRNYLGQNVKTISLIEKSSINIFALRAGVYFITFYDAIGNRKTIPFVKPDNRK